MIKKSMIGLCIAVACMTASIFSLSGCEPHEGSEDQLKADVDSFANNYFNWHFPKAVKYCTQESERWLRYAASNVNETDVELLRQKPEDASIEITDIISVTMKQVPPLPLRFIIFCRWTASDRIRSS